MNHRQWLANEYSLWIEALQSSTVHNFKEHPQVKRMLGEVDGSLFKNVYWGPAKLSDLLWKIDCIGFENPSNYISPSGIRMIYYVQKILELKPKGIVEIGGGSGQFFAMLRAYGYEGCYDIFDLPEVEQFQYEYLLEVQKQTGLDTTQLLCGTDLCVSFYALGEFDDDTKKQYISDVVNKCPHGFIIWNPHSGASNDLSLIKHNIQVKPENPLTSEGNLEITW